MRLTRQGDDPESHATDAGAVRRTSRTRLRASIAAAVVVVFARAVAPIDGDGTTPAPATLFAVGDIMFRATADAAQATGQLMERMLDETPNSRGITLGDNCNDNGSEECYDRFDQSSWGRLRSVLFPVPGNHDYQESLITRSVPHYYLYFPNAGPSELGYHAFDWGGWRVLALNSEIMGHVENDPVSARRRDEQLVWLERELRLHARTQCVLAYFHRPPFSSGDFASPSWVMPIFRRLYKYGVDLYLTGHEHFFAYLPPLSPEGTVDHEYGVPGLIAGTGGAVLFPDPRSRSDPKDPKLRRTLKWARDGETLVANRLGVVRIDLGSQAYSWAFVPVDGAPSAVYPSGSGRCHPNPPG